MTIEERANNYVENTYSPSDTSEFQFAMNLAVYKGYVQGATEQREIDIEKTIKWLANYEPLWQSDCVASDLINEFELAMKGEVK